MRQGFVAALSFWLVSGAGSVLTASELMKSGMRGVACGHCWMQAGGFVSLQLEDMGSYAGDDWMGVEEIGCQVE